MLNRGEHHLVLLDIQLPDMTGAGYLAELTKRYPREDLPPLVALTANVLKDKQEYLNAGMDDVLSKPLSVPALTAMIKKFWDTQDDEESAGDDKRTVNQKHCSIFPCWNSFSRTCRTEADHRRVSGFKDDAGLCQRAGVESDGAG